MPSTNWICPGHFCRYEPGTIRNLQSRLYPTGVNQTGGKGRTSPLGQASSKNPFQQALSQLEPTCARVVLNSRRAVLRFGKSQRIPSKPASLVRNRSVTKSSSKEDFLHPKQLIRIADWERKAGTVHLLLSCTFHLPQKRLELKACKVALRHSVAYCTYYMRRPITQLVDS
jgi:hypothetical protein